MLCRSLILQSRFLTTSLKSTSLHVVNDVQSDEDKARDDKKFPPMPTPTTLEEVEEGFNLKSIAVKVSIRNLFKRQINDVKGTSYVGYFAQEWSSSFSK